MRFIDLIGKKRNGQELTKEEIHFFIEGYVKGDIPDYQVSAMLMAIIFKGMTKQEIFDLTEEMLNSGETIDLSEIEGYKVDKHSTGGVGDKTSLVLGPMVAACGAKFAKMSGRGLGHTGGTLDKLESIPGFNISLDRKEFIEQVKRIGISIIGQTGSLVPADKKLYALRDVTNTVDSIPLIASSIMSKKLASGSNTILLDVKFGDGAFMKNIEDATKLAKMMVEIGNYFGRDTRAEITSMEEPLGLAVGNNLEVKEVVDTLLGHGPEDLTNICLHSGSTMILQAKLANSFEEAHRMLKEKLDDGTAYKVFLEFVKAQNGDISYIEDTSKFPLALYREKVYAPRSGYISKCNALTIGLAAMKLGGGRERKEDTIDMSSGIVLKHKVGEFVNKGDELATLYTERPKYEPIVKEILGAFEIVDEKVEKPRLILDTIEA